MTAKKASTTKGTTFGDAEVIEDAVTEPEVNNGPENEAVTEAVEQGKAAGIEDKDAEEFTETVEKLAAPSTWAQYEPVLREEFVGVLYGRKIEEAIRFVKKGWDAAGGK